MKTQTVSQVILGERRYDAIVAEANPFADPGLVRAAKQAWEHSKPDTYADVHDRTKSKLWAEMRSEGREEGFDPAELTYDF